MAVRCVRHLMSWLAVAALPLLSGCQSSGGIGDMLSVALPQDQKQTVPVGSGPLLLANSTWAGFRVADEGEPVADPAATPSGPYGGLLNGGIIERPPAGKQFFLADFGPDGSFTAVRENRYFVPEIYGATLLIDANMHAASIPGITFRPVSFGASEGDQVGMAIVVDVHAIGLHAGTATIYAWGTVDGDRLDGKFGYQIEFEGLLSLLKSGGDQYPFYATRQTD